MRKYILKTVRKLKYLIKLFYQQKILPGKHQHYLVDIVRGRLQLTLLNEEFHDINETHYQNEIFYALLLLMF